MKKTSVHTTRKNPLHKKEILKGLKNGETVIYNRKKYTFIEYRDYGFTCILKDDNNDEHLVFGNTIKRAKKN